MTTFVYYLYGPHKEKLSDLSVTSASQTGIHIILLRFLGRINRYCKSALIYDALMMKWSDYDPKQAEKDSCHDSSQLYLSHTDPAHLS